MKITKYGLAVALGVVALLGASVVRADSVTINPDTSATWIVGTSFEPGEIAQTADPLGPFSRTPVQFQGFQFGGSQVSLNPGPCSLSNPCLVFDYNLNFSTPTAINSITFVGDAFNLATFQLLDSSNSVLDSLSVSSGNVGHPVTYTLLTPGVSGTLFSLKLYDDSTTWTYVTNISVNTAVPEPSTLLMLGVGLLGFVVTVRRKWFEPGPLPITVNAEHT